MRIGFVREWDSTQGFGRGSNTRVAEMGWRWDVREVGSGMEVGCEGSGMEVGREMSELRTDMGCGLFAMLLI